MHPSGYFESYRKQLALFLFAHYSAQGDRKGGSGRRFVNLALRASLYLE
jgi:hypothetical protein